jgi:hypothetical protein
MITHTHTYSLTKRVTECVPCLCPSHFMPGKNPNNQYIRGWVILRAGWTYLRIDDLFEATNLTRLKKYQLTWQLMSDTVWHYHCLLSDIYIHLTSAVWIVLSQNLLTLVVLSQCIWQLKWSSLECSVLNCDRYNNSCTVKDVLLTCKNIYFLRI